VEGSWTVENALRVEELRATLANSLLRVEERRATLANATRIVSDSSGTTNHAETRELNQVYTPPCDEYLGVIPPFDCVYVDHCHRFERSGTLQSKPSKVVTRDCKSRAPC
jgi:hypothetical protein